MPESRPRVGIIAPIKTWGGIELTVALLCREFVARGIIPELVSIRGGKTPYPELLPEEVQTRELKTRSKLDGVPRVAAYLRESPPAAVITAKDHAAQVALLARALSRTRVPIFVKVTNTLNAVARRPAKRFMIRRLYPRADGVIAVSRGVADDLVTTFGIPRDKIEVIYNPVVTPQFPERMAAAVTHPWFQSGAPPVILGTGRLTPQKDFVTLVEAFAQVRALRQCHLVILGEGTQRAAIESRAQSLGVAESVQLPGFVPDPLPYMRRAGVFVLSSRHEGLGNVLVEALATGTAVVSTDCPSGPAEILQGGRYGRLVPPGDAAAMAMAIQGALDDTADREEVSASIRRFESAHVAERYLRFIGLAGADEQRV